MLVRMWMDCPKINGSQKRMWKWLANLKFVRPRLSQYTQRFLRVVSVSAPVCFCSTKRKGASERRPGSVGSIETIAKRVARTSGLVDPRPIKKRKGDPRRVDGI